MKKIIECPYCPGKAELKKEQRVLSFRKEDFNVIAHFYRCDTCNEEFTTTDSDELTITQLYNQYREIHRIPFPDEIIRLRHMYNVSAAKMSDILGFGTNTYSNYEKGEMPTIANANLIRTASVPENFLELLESINRNSHAAYHKIVQHVHSIIKAKSEQQQDCLSPLHEVPSALTGYKLFDIDRLKNMLITFLNSCAPEFNDRIKLNKLFFYTDFYHYANFGISLSGLKYRAIPYGPAPAYYDQIFAYIEQDLSFTCTSKKVSDGNVVELYSSDSVFDSLIFSEQELLTLETITTTFQNVSSWDMKELSHKEKAWIELAGSRSLISYQKYAFDLLAIE